MYQQLLKMAVRQSIKALFATACRIHFLKSQGRRMQKESERARQFGQLFDHFAPKRQPLLFSAFTPWIASTKGDLPVYSAETYLGVHSEIKKKK